MRQLQSYGFHDPFLATTPRKGKNITSYATGTPPADTHLRKWRHRQDLACREIGAIIGRSVVHLDDLRWHPGQYGTRDNQLVFNEVVELGRAIPGR